MGGNRVEIQANFEPNKCDNGSLGDNDDCISKLPEDILVDFLSRLSLKEAARTSVLSPRWKDLWKRSPFLDFDAESVLHKINKHNPSLELIEIEGPKYVEWVNSVIQSHKAPTLKEFKIHFYLDRKHTNAITRWLEFAFSRKVERLELNHENFINANDYYCFPEPEEIQPHTAVNYYKSLKALSFNCVHMTDTAIDFFLRNCPQLEELTVHRSRKLSNLEVCGSSLVLKHLDLRWSYYLKSLKVWAPFLTSLKIAITKELLLENVPMLVEVSLTCCSVDSLISQLSCCFSQLEVLSISLLAMTREEMSELDYFPKMPKLKKLFVEYKECGYERPLRLMAALIRVSPHLEEFVLQYNNFPPMSMKDGRIKNAMWFPNRHLKVVKISFDYGWKSDVMVEVIGCILRNCAVLEKIIIDTSGGHVPMRDQHRILRRRNAKQQLKPQIPPNIEFLVL